MTSTSDTPSAVLVHEYVTGGGWPGGEPPPGLRAEALAILRALLADFRAWGRLPVVTTRDRHRGDVRLAADRVVDVDAAGYPEAVLELARECGAALLVAPEGDGVAARLTGLVASVGARLLGSSEGAIAACADKWVCGRRWEAAGLAVPRMEKTSAGTASSAADRVGYPVVVKPRTGAGCQGVGLATSPDELERAVAALVGAAAGGSDAAGKTAGAAGAGDVLVQEYVAGLPASVSLLVSARESRVLSLNRQDVRPGIPFAYSGGEVFISHPRAREACELAQRAVALEPGLRGHVGVDLVLTEDGCRLIEVNPRPTTSYVGLRGALDGRLNLAAAAWEACLEDRLPSESSPPRSVSFALEVDDAL